MRAEDIVIAELKRRAEAAGRAAPGRIFISRIPLEEREPGVDYSEEALAAECLRALDRIEAGDFEEITDLD